MPRTARATSRPRFRLTHPLQTTVTLQFLNAREESVLLLPVVLSSLLLQLAQVVQKFRTRACKAGAEEESEDRLAFTFNGLVNAV